MAENYDEAYCIPDYFGAEASPLLRHCGPWLAGDARVLDIGAGQGRNALPPARSGCRVTAIDPSATAVRSLSDLAGREGLDLVAHQVGFEDFVAAEPFDVVFCFGLLQMVAPEAGRRLLAACRRWVRPGGVLALTAWHRGDPSYASLRATWTELEPGCFRSPDKPHRYRSFLARGEIAERFADWQIVYHCEGLGPKHRHGDGPEERHGQVDWVAQRPRD